MHSLAPEGSHPALLLPKSLKGAASLSHSKGSDPEEAEAETNPMTCSENKPQTGLMRRWQAIPRGPRGPVESKLQ